MYLYVAEDNDYAQVMGASKIFNFQKFQIFIKLQIISTRVRF